ncbi:MAG: PTS IIA-like nitrogen regulatory protein PtsN [Pseudomonadota bacterium]|nr:PTS IIA-like nitrogen regulatory protein PtsN [Pseudomonadota bacterium]
MELTDLITPDHVIAGMRATSKKQALQELARRSAEVSGLEQREIFDILLERERLGTTGIGRGIAIPHGKHDRLNGLVGVFARIDKAIDFDAVDGEPVDLLFLLLAPPSAGADHLKALAKVSRTLRDQTICTQLRGCEDADGIYALLAGTSTSNAA